MKKLLTILLCASLLFTGLPLAASADHASASAESISILTARNLAAMYVAVWSFPAEDGETVRFGSDFTLANSIALYNADEEPTFLLFGFTSDTDPDMRGYIILSLRSNLPLLTDIALGDAPFADAQRVYYLDPLHWWAEQPDGTLVNREGIPVDRKEMNSFFANRTPSVSEDTGEVEQENETVLDALRKMRGMDTNALFAYLKDLFYRLTKYFLFYVWYGPDWNPEEANRTVEERIKEYAAEKGHVYLESFTVDKNAFAPQYQRYFSDGEPVGDGVCGVAAWLLLLGYYRDGCGYDKLPDDQTMYLEVMEIMDEITETFSGVFGLVDRLAEIIRENTEFYIPSALQSYELIGLLDAGIAKYLCDKGYGYAAANVINNLSISVPLLTSLQEAVLCKRVRNAVAEWLYSETGGEWNIPTGLQKTAGDVVIRSMLRGEPAVIGNWLSLTDRRLTNHYFTAAGLHRFTGSIALADGMDLEITKNYLELYDTWNDDACQIIDWDVFTRTALYDANSLAALR